jgi:hypothetical protein
MSKLMSKQISIFEQTSSREELAVCLFCSTQTKEKLNRSGVKGKENIAQTYLWVNIKVRQVIKDLGGKG